MIVGVAKEIKNNENRVALTPAGAQMLRTAGHAVLVEENAGVGSGFHNEAFEGVGAEIVREKKRLFDLAEMVMKVKAPMPPEYGQLQSGQILFTYLHLASEQELTRALLERKVIGIAYETIEGCNGTLPLLFPMSVVAGRMAVQIGAQLLEKTSGGKGVLLGGVPGVAPSQVVILGGGTVGQNAARIALGMGARVAIIEISSERLRHLNDLFDGRVSAIKSNSQNITRWVKVADLLIGAVLIPGARAPKLVTEEMVASMEPGSVIVDVAIDQGGCIETIDRATTHSDPIYVKHGIVHHAVANMPGVVARTSTLALAHMTIDYALKIANKGFRQAVLDDPGLAKGVNVLYGNVTLQTVADSLGLPFMPLEKIIGLGS